MITLLIIIIIIITMIHFIKHLKKTVNEVLWQNKAEGCRIKHISVNCSDEWYKWHL